MSDDSVRRIEHHAFYGLDKLIYVQLSRNLEYIQIYAFGDSTSLASIFIPPSCREIHGSAFTGCKQLIIFNVPRHTELGLKVISETKLIRVSSFEIEEDGEYDITISENVNEWIKNINGDDEYALHRACSSYNPITQVIYDIVKRQGLKAFNKRNQIGLTPLEYLNANPYAEDIDQHSLMKKYIFEMMGQIV